MISAWVRSFLRTFFCRLFKLDRPPFIDTVVLELASGPCSARELYARVQTHGWRLSAPTFYLRMADLEDKGLVYGWYMSGTIDGVPVSSRWYQLKGK